MATNCNRVDDVLFSQRDESTTSTTSTSTSTSTTTFTSGANKYGGLVPKKRPLISKGYKRAFFDSADWALHKQEACIDQATLAAIENLRPKFQRTPRRQRDPKKPTCASGEENLADSSF
ncbi:hypothetical protein V5N11_031537 [Cardamine amara subsp. amara]|uniref:Uncharacterized protein n=1 Tax=Cardamine amara subsp. amara TaxID=228776 RepID=A0ABD0ZJ75_CARAN